MEYIDGEPIHRYCDANSLSIDRRVELFQEVCGAVHFAHQRLIVHRDIKPSNILVTKEGIPKLLDFGIAKLLESDGGDGGLTQAFDQPMTPDYASPEQMNGETITTASDVYSLGVVLYELLSGHRPYRLQGGSPADWARRLGDHEPEKPSTALARIEERLMPGGTRVTPQAVSAMRGDHPDRLRRRLTGDLDWITLKALEKDRTRRYATALDLAADIGRHLDHQPVLAGPPTAVYSIRKFVRRHRVGVLAVAIVALALLWGTVGILWQARRALQERDRAIAAERMAEDRLHQAKDARNQAESVTKFLSGMLAAADPGTKGRDVTVREILDEASAALGEKFKDQPLLEARLRDTIGIAYGQLGVYDAAEEHLVAAVRIGQRLLGEQHPDTLSWTNDLASALARHGSLREAHSAAHRTYEIRRRVLGEGDPATLQSKHNLVMHLYNDGKWSQASELARETLDAMRSARGEQHPATAKAMYGLAINLGALRDPQAKELFRATLEIQRRTLGEEHPDVLKTMTGIATEAYNAGEFAEAARLLRQLIEIQSRVLGADHPEAARSMNNLALCLYELGEWAEGDAWGQQSLDIKRRRLGDRHPDTLSSLDTRITSLVHHHHLAEADRLARQILAEETAVWGSDGVRTFTAQHRLAYVLAAGGRLQEAEELYREVLDGRRRVLGDEHPDTRVSASALAEMRRKRGEGMP
jgi:serine/threonine protein kinase